MASEKPCVLVFVTECESESGSVCVWAFVMPFVTESEMVSD